MSEYNIKVEANQYSLLKSGQEFYEAARRCSGENKDGEIVLLGETETPLLPAATAVNASFACEMYLKALLLHRNIPFPTGKDGHNLHKLFLMLPETTKQVIDSFIGIDQKDGSSDFCKFTEMHQKDFVDARYYATRSGWQSLSPISLLRVAFNFGQITSCIIEKNLDL